MTKAQAYALIEGMTTEQKRELLAFLQLLKARQAADKPLEAQEGGAPDER